MECDTALGRRPHRHGNTLSLYSLSLCLSLAEATRFSEAFLHLCASDNRLSASKQSPPSGIRQGGSTPRSPQTAVLLWKALRQQYDEVPAPAGSSLSGSRKMSDSSMLPHPVPPHWPQPRGQQCTPSRDTPSTPSTWHVSSARTAQHGGGGGGGLLGIVTRM